jgi:hypothetical protein
MIIAQSERSNRRNFRLFRRRHMHISGYICKHHFNPIIAITIISHYYHCIHSFFSMPPKTTFSIPLRDVVEIVSETKRTKRGLRTTEKEVPIDSSKDKKTGQSSRSKSQAHRNATTKLGRASGHISSDDGESIPLRHTAQEDIIEDQGGDGGRLTEGEGYHSGPVPLPETQGQGNVGDQIASHPTLSDV